MKDDDQIAALRRTVVKARKEAADAVVAMAVDLIRKGTPQATVDQFVEVMLSRMEKGER